MSDTRETNQIEERQIRVFISSTFRDMQSERDYLVMKIFPVIRRYCEDRDISFFELDLRWGISEEESKQGKVVNICLKEIQNTKPFFIGLLGERYGWVPSGEERRLIAENTDVFEEYPWIGAELDKGTSITEMEIQQGVLRNPDTINAYFYFRSSGMQTPDEFREKSGSDAEKKLLALKKALREQEHYPVKYYTSIEVLGDLIEKDFKELVDTLWPEGAISFLEKEQLEQKAFLKSRTKVYIPNEKALQKLDDFVDASGEDADRFMVITGEKGMGKSALIANWIQRRQKRDEKIIYHFIGNSGSEGDYRKISEYLINELECITGIKRDKDSLIDSTKKREDKLTETLQDMLWTAAKNEKIILVLDGMDKLSDVENAKLLNWLPAFPSHTRIIFSTQADDKTMDVFKRRNYPCIELEALSIDNRKILIEKYLAVFAKKLLPAQIERIVKDRESENTLALRVLLDELRIFGVHEEIDTHLNAYLAAPDLESFYDIVVERIEKTYGNITGRIANFAGEVLALLASSRAGLSEDEILGITRAAPLYWSQLYNGMAGHLVKRNGLIVFDNWFIQTAAAKRKKDGGEEYRHRIISYMETASDISLDRKRDELPHQYFELKEWDKLYAFLLNLAVFDYIYTKNEYELGLYWRVLLKENKEQYSFAKYLALEESGKDEAASYINALGLFALESLADYVMALEFFQKARAVDEKVLGVEHPNTATLYNNIGGAYSSKGDYEKALAFHQKALAIDEKILGVEHPSTATSYNNIGLVYHSMGEYEKALEFQQKALAVREKILGVEHPSTATSYGNIGSAYGGMGDNEKALEFHQKALAVCEKVLGVEHPDTALSYGNIGGVYSSMGDYKKGLEFQQKALAVREKVLGVEHPLTATSYSNIGGVYDSIRDYEKALEFCQKALAIREKVLGVEHPSTAKSYNNIGGVYYSIRDYEKALEFQQKALAVREKVLGVEHPDTALSYNNIGFVYKKMGDNEKALEFYQKGLAIWEKVLGVEHPLTATSYSNIGGVYDSIRDYEKALEFCQKALAIREKVLGLEHPSTAKSYNNIGLVYSKMGDNEKALEFFQKAMVIREKIFGIEHPATTTSYDDVALTYSNMGRYEEALELYQKALAIREKIPRPEHPDTATAYNNVAVTYRNMGRYEEALEFYQKALAIREKVLGAEHPDTVKTLQRIAALHELMGNTEEAHAIREKMERLKKSLMV
ncbi:hypothetical protein FACS1894172_08200 [Spirochaetia bacterium]|nr:hypothetical protein FACS1894164_07800 [Spirochaetia bacterium]GHU32127.1 hypothetical protein FACS1894172_08200 [Spirochaetia bacterium]